MKDTSLVSIAIPAYNHASFIETCLASVCAQTYQNIELVLIDDGSTDDTFEIAERFLDRKRNRFRHIVLQKMQNRGVSANSNACIEACQGKWVHLLGSDDILSANKVERIQHFIDEWCCPDLALVHADCGYIDENGEIVTRKRNKSRPAPGPDYRAYQWLFLGKHYIYNPTIALNREIFLSTGGFDETLPLEDLDCWLRLSVDYAVARVPEILASYRKHPGNSSRRRTKMLSAQFSTYAKFLSTNPGLIDESAMRQHFRENVLRFWRRVRRKEPWQLAYVGASIIRSHWQTPTTDDYRRFGLALEDIAAES